MAATTLALGSASYELLDALVTTSPNSTPGTGATATLSAKQRGGTIGGATGAEKVDLTVPFGTAAGQASALNVSSVSNGLIVRDNDSALVGGSSGSDATVNFLANASNAQVLLGGGNNRFNASRDFVASALNSGDGNDSIRIGGAANGSLFNTAGGNDSLIVGKTSADVDANLGAGNDSALFLGALIAGSDSTKSWDSSVQAHDQFNGDYNNIVNLGEGNDSASFQGGVTGNYELQMGGGADTTVFGSRSLNSGFLLDTGSGSDSTVLGFQTNNVEIQLGSGPFSDTLVLGLGADLLNSTISSSQSGISQGLGDRLLFAGDLMSVGIQLGSGRDSLNLTGTASFAGPTDSWSLADGNDTVILGASSDVFGHGLISLGAGADSLFMAGTGDDFMIDLGSDWSADTIAFAATSPSGEFGYTGLTINNFSNGDILLIGNDVLTYSGLASYTSPGYAADQDSSVWSSFFSAGNRINTIVSNDTLSSGGSTMPSMTGSYPSTQDSMMWGSQYPGIPTNRIV